MRYLLIVCLLFLSYSCAGQGIYYIGPNGKIDNPGTQDKPFSFSYLEQKIDHSGDTFIVLEGEYPGHFNTYVYGTKDHPVTIKSDGWMKADLTGLPVRSNIPGSDKTTTKILNNYGGFSNWIDFEVYHGHKGNRTIETGKPLTWSSGFNNFGEESNFYGIVSHDVLIGPSTWSTNIGGSIVGCITYNVGWRNLNSKRPNQGHGHGGYIQNKAGELSRKTYGYNTVWGVASEGLHLYTESSNKINNFTIYKNVIYNLAGYNIHEHPERAFLIGGHYGAHNLIFSGNHVYKEYSKFGLLIGVYHSDGLTWNVKDDIGNVAESGKKHRFNGESFNMVFDNNYIYGTVNFNFLRNIKSFKGNTFIRDERNPINISETTLYKRTDYPFENNTVYNASKLTYLPWEGKTTHIPFDQIGWSSLNKLSDNPSNEVFFDIMPFNSKRARVVIYNHENLDYVVTKIPFAKDGDRIQIRDAENIKEVIYDDKYTGNYSFNMGLNKLAEIQGNIPSDHVSHSDKGFNVFYVEVVEAAKEDKPIVVVEPDPEPTPTEQEPEIVTSPSLPVNQDLVKRIDSLFATHAASQSAKYNLIINELSKLLEQIKKNQLDINRKRTFKEE